MEFQKLIAARRQGEPHTKEELEELARGAATDSIPDYQLAAWLMAACFNPLSEQETAWLTLAMADSGERLDLTGVPEPWVDKHSTGGVGDKTTIVLLPLLAACGLSVVKMSGRGLGITGGTVDKLSAVPGFRLDLEPEQMKAQAARIGLAITGQTPNLAPADKKLYALRDATATVASIPLIVSSILSKKLAGGARIVVLDVKCGSGAFMKNRKEARELARWLTRIGSLCGLSVRAAITDMSQPLGRAVGNALEVAEALGTLRPGSPGGSERLARLCVRLAGITLAAAGMCSQKEGEKTALRTLQTGAAWDKAADWFGAQGYEGNLAQLPSIMQRAPTTKKVFHQGGAGYAARVDAGVVGETVLELGGGRRVKNAQIDLSVGVEVEVEVGDAVEKGQLLFVVHARNESEADAAAASLASAVEVTDAPVRRPRQIIALL